MRLYKIEELFDKDGNVVKSVRKVKGYLCDLTGEFAKYSDDLGTSYGTDYSDSDPNFGCGEGEFEFSEKWGVDIYSVLGGDFVFNERDCDQDKTPLERMIEEAKEEGFDRWYLDQLMRYTRIKMLDKVLTEGTYTLEELGIEKEDE